MHWERVCSVVIVLFRDIFSHLRCLRYFPHRYSLCMANSYLEVGHPPDLGPGSGFGFRNPLRFFNLLAPTPKNRPQPGSAYVRFRLQCTRPRG